jgi:hypothetical protein
MILLAGALAWIGISSATGPTSEQGEANAALGDATVTVDTSDPGREVPRDFLGLSFEVAALGAVSADASHGDLTRLLSSLHGGELRFGGVSADTPGTAPVTAAQLRGIGTLARADDLSVLLTLDAGRPDPAAAAREAAAAKAALGSRLAGLAVGNEPDAFANVGLRSQPWTFDDYSRQVATYLPALLSAAPGVPLAGPEASSGVPPLQWVQQFAHTEHPTQLTDHFYPSSSCGYTPKLTDLLSPALRTTQESMLGRLTALSHTEGIPLRVDETNNISCSGEADVSNAFASALWAVDYITEAMSSGVTGLNFHDLLGEPTSYAPLAALDTTALNHGVLTAQPEWYALLLADRLLGDRPVHAVASGAGTDLSATALLAVPGSAGVRVRLAVPIRYRRGSILRMKAASASATDGVTLGGRTVAADGHWAPQSPLPGVHARGGSLTVELDADTAALITLRAGGAAHG